MKCLSVICVALLVSAVVSANTLKSVSDIKDNNSINVFSEEIEFDVAVPSGRYAHYPTISENYAIYAVGTACDYTWSIRYKKFGSDVVKRFEQYGLSTNPDVEGDIVVWQGDGKTFGPYTHEPCITSIYMGKLSTNESKELIKYDSTYSQSYSHPAISKNKVVWVEHFNLDLLPAEDPNNWYDMPYNICGADISDYDNPVFFTVDCNVGSRDPYPYWYYGSDFYDIVDISNNIVVWEGRGDIYGADISDTNNIRTFIICNDPAVQDDPAISGNIVVWTDYRDPNKVSIYAADISDINNIKEFTITPKDGYFCLPAIDNNIIIYIEAIPTEYGQKYYIKASMLIRDNLVVELPISENCMGLEPDICGNNIIWQTADYGDAKAINLQPYYSIIDGPIENITTGERYDFIRDAIHLSNDKEKIAVPTGIYTTAIDFENKNITLTSIDPNNANTVASTIISDCNVAVIFAGAQDAKCCLNGFTITDCNTGFYCNQSSPTIKNCNVFGNLQGSDIYISDPTISNCQFYDNTNNALNIHDSSFPTITNCLIAKNGGIGLNCQCDGSPNIKNCTIADNAGVGLYFWRSYTNAYITNSIIFNNGTSQISGSLNIPKLTYCNIQDGFEGLGNINCDPMFANSSNNDYHLKSQGSRFDKYSGQWVSDATTSRCIDAGNPSCCIGSELTKEFQNIRINLGYYGGTNEASLGPLNWALLADINNDNIVDITDIGYITQNWLKNQGNNPCDLNRNGIVNLTDYALAVK